MTPEEILLARGKGGGGAKEEKEGKHRHCSAHAQWLATPLLRAAIGKSRPKIHEHGTSYQMHIPNIVRPSLDAKKRFGRLKATLRVGVLGLCVPGHRVRGRRISPEAPNSPEGEIDVLAEQECPQSPKRVTTKLQYGPSMVRPWSVHKSRANRQNGLAATVSRVMRTPTDMHSNCVL